MGAIPDQGQWDISNTGEWDIIFLEISHQPTLHHSFSIPLVDSPRYSNLVLPVCMLLGRLIFEVNEGVKSTEMTQFVPLTALVSVGCCRVRVRSKKMCGRYV